VREAFEMNTRKVVRIVAFLCIVTCAAGGGYAVLAANREQAPRPGSEEDHTDHAHGAVTHESGAGRADPDDEHEELHLTAEQQRLLGVAVRVAGPGSLRNELRLPGEIAFNEDRVAHLVPRVAGVVAQVMKTIGDAVQAGEVLAVIDSRELADAKAEYLAARARRSLADATYAREESLWDKQISSERDRLEAQQTLAEADISMRAAERKLCALGLPRAAVRGLGCEHDEAITRYEIRSPLAGIVTEKHIVLGESLDADTHIFTVADLDSVWANLTVYAKDLAAVREGQDVSLLVDHSGARGRGRVAMVTPFADVSTRSATARIVLDNRGSRWVPGTFVTGLVIALESNLPVVIPRNAVQTIEGRHVAFVAHDDGFEMVPVTPGRTDREHIEIRTGLEPGTPYVAEGAFELKAMVVTRGLGSHAGHGH